MNHKIVFEQLTNRNVPVKMLGTLSRDDAAANENGA